MTCNTCTLPARFYVSAVIGHEQNWAGLIGSLGAKQAGMNADVREVDGYYCGKHAPSRRGLITGDLARYNFAVLGYKRVPLPS